MLTRVLLVRYTLIAHFTELRKVSFHLRNTLVNISFPQANDYFSIEKSNTEYTDREIIDDTFEKKLQLGLIAEHPVKPQLVKLCSANATFSPPLKTQRGASGRLASLIDTYI